MEKEKNLESILKICDLISQELKEETLIPFIDMTLYDELTHTEAEDFLSSVKDDKIKESFKIIYKHLNELSEINFFDKLNFIEYIFSNKNNLPEELWTLILQMFSLFYIGKIDKDFIKDLNSFDEALEFYKPFIQNIPYEKDGIFFAESMFINLIFMYSKEKSSDFRSN